MTVEYPFSRHFQNPEDETIPVFETAAFTTKGIPLYIQGCGVPDRFLLRVFKPMEKPHLLDETPESLKQMLVKEGIISFNDWLFRKNHGWTKKNFSLCRYEGTGNRFFWMIWILVADEPDNIYARCNVPLSQFDPTPGSNNKLPGLTPSPSGIRNPAQEPYLLTAVPERGIKERTGYRLNLLVNSRNLGIWFYQHFETVQAARGKRIPFWRLTDEFLKPFPDCKLLSGYKRCAVPFTTMYYPEHFALPRRIILAVRHLFYLEKLTFWLPAWFPAGAYGACHPLRIASAPVALPGPREQMTEVICRDNSPLSDRGRNLRRLLSQSELQADAAQRISAVITELPPVSVMIPRIDGKFSGSVFDTKSLQGGYKKLLEEALKVPNLAKKALMRTDMSLEIMDEQCKHRAVRFLSLLAELLLYRKSLDSRPQAEKNERRQLRIQLDRILPLIKNQTIQVGMKTERKKSTILRARQFAARAHGSQLYGNKPYIEHLNHVASLVLPDKGRQLLEIAFLHHVLETTDISREILEKEFGQSIARCVSLVTDEPGDARADGKEKTCLKLSQVEEPYTDALIVKAADRLADLQDCRTQGSREKMKMYLLEHEAFHKAVYREGLCDSLWIQIKQIVREESENLIS